jgi:hypothetical protein
MGKWRGPDGNVYAGFFIDAGNVVAGWCLTDCIIARAYLSAEGVPEGAAWLGPDGQHYPGFVVRIEDDCKNTCEVVAGWKLPSGEVVRAFLSSTGIPESAGWLGPDNNVYPGFVSDHGVIAGWKLPGGIMARAYLNCRGVPEGAAWLGPDGQLWPGFVAAGNTLQPGWKLPNGSLVLAHLNQAGVPDGPAPMWTSDTRSNLQSTIAMVVSRTAGTGDARCSAWPTQGKLQESHAATSCTDTSIKSPRVSPRHIAYARSSQRHRSALSA